MIQTGNPEFLKFRYKIILFHMIFNNFFKKTLKTSKSNFVFCPMSWHIYLEYIETSLDEGQIPRHKTRSCSGRLAVIGIFLEGVLFCFVLQTLPSETSSSVMQRVKNWFFGGNKKKDVQTEVQEQLQIDVTKNRALLKKGKSYIIIYKYYYP